MFLTSLSASFEMKFNSLNSTCLKPSYLEMKLHRFDIHIKNQCRSYNKNLCLHFYWHPVMVVKWFLRKIAPNFQTQILFQFISTRINHIVICSNQAYLLLDPYSLSSLQQPCLGRVTRTHTYLAGSSAFCESYFAVRVDFL